MQRDEPVFSSIQQPSVVEQIIETIKQSVIRGDLKPGQRLPSESELTQQLQVGRSAIREAMKVLQALGVVTIRQGDGTYIVEKPSSTMLSPLVFAIMLETGMNDELSELRVLIQIGYCELAAQKATDNDWIRIEAAAQALEDYAADPDHEDVETLTHLDIEFHYAILDATHNPLIIKIGRTVEELFFTSIRNTLAAGSDWAIESHRRIIAALRDGSPERVREAVEYSLRYWRQEVKKQNS